jgi:O-antigen chain-terminating methyltransferase
MDQNEIAQRLKELRDHIRAELDAAEPPRLAAGLPDSGAPSLDEFEPPGLPTEPELTSTEHLHAANQGAEITGPVELRSQVPGIGPVLTLLRRLMRPFVQPLIDPYLDRQERFNASVVRHLNELGVRVEERITAVHQGLLEQMIEPRLLESRLDTALGEYDETLRQRHVVLFDALEEELWALRGMTQQVHEAIGAQMHAAEVRFVERAQAVDARFDEKDSVVTDLAAQIDRLGDLPGKAEMFETRTRLEAVLEALGTAPPATAAPGHDAVDADQAQLQWAGLREWMSDQDYRAHQHAFRGDPDEISERMTAHVQRFVAAPGPVADLGCGRGEFLELLREAGIDAVGVEINEADVEDCRERGLDAEHADLFDWLGQREEGTLGGIFLAQVIEHLPPPLWQKLVRIAVSRLAPGGSLVIETINPESLYAMVRAYVIDPTHVRPVHPSLLALLASRAGFEEIDVHYQAPVPASFRPDAIDEALADEGTALRRVVEELNQRLHRLDQLCCLPQEYALVARRGRS